VCRQPGPLAQPQVLGTTGAGAVLFWALRLAELQSSLRSWENGLYQAALPVPSHLSPQGASSGPEGPYRDLPSWASVGS
jgi:hypothetical protein